MRKLKLGEIAALSTKATTTCGTSNSKHNGQRVKKNCLMPFAKLRQLMSS